MIPVIFINCKSAPFVHDIMLGQKQYETRTRNMLGHFIGERVLFAETGHGTPYVKCSAVIDQVISVTTQEQWNEYIDSARIPTGSKYDWKQDTKIKWLYHLTDVRPVLPFHLPTDSLRHGRVWAECNKWYYELDEIKAYFPC